MLQMPRRPQIPLGIRMAPRAWRTSNRHLLPPVGSATASRPIHRSLRTSGRDGHSMPSGRAPESPERRDRGLPLERRKERYYGADFLLRHMDTSNAGARPADYSIGVSVGLSVVKAPASPSGVPRHAPTVSPLALSTFTHSFTHAQGTSTSRGSPQRGHVVSANSRARLSKSGATPTATSRYTIWR